MRMTWENKFKWSTSRPSTETSSIIPSLKIKVILSLKQGNNSNLFHPEKNNNTLHNGPERFFVDKQITPV